MSLRTTITNQRIQRRIFLTIKNILYKKVHIYVAIQDHFKNTKITLLKTKLLQLSQPLKDHLKIEVLFELYCELNWLLHSAFSLNFQGDQRLAITPPFPETSDSRIRALRAQVPKIQDLKFYHVKDSYEEVVQGLIKYENQLLVKNYKFGILYVKEGQTDENQYFNNGKVSETGEP